MPERAARKRALTAAAAPPWPPAGHGTCTFSCSVLASPVLGEDGENSQLASDSDWLAGR
jgi:hypothetical protein